MRLCMLLGAALLYRSTDAIRIAGEKPDGAPEPPAAADAPENSKEEPEQPAHPVMDAGHHFDLHDKDQDGHISKQELHDLFSMDTHHSILTRYVNQQGKTSTKELKAHLDAVDDEFFSQVDANGDGKVTSDELEVYTSKKIDAYLKKGDADGDGKLTEAELESIHAEITSVRYSKDEL